MTHPPAGSPGVSDNDSDNESWTENDNIEVWVDYLIKIFNGEAFTTNEIDDIENVAGGNFGFFDPTSVSINYIYQIYARNIINNTACWILNDFFTSNKNNTKTSTGKVELSNLGYSSFDPANPRISSTTAPIINGKTLPSSNMRIDLTLA